MTLPFKIEYAIVCDQVRREDNGKLMFIGVYGSSILMNKLPATLALSLVMKVKPLKLGDFKLQFRTTLDGDELAVGEMEIKLESDETAFAGLPGVPLAITRTGLLKWEARSGSTRYALLGQIPIGINPASTAFAPPS